MSITTILYRAAVTITAVAAATLGGAGLASAVTQPAPHGTHRITEDNPRWNCRTMGNHICGRTLPRPCYFDGGGAITSGSTARTDTGLWTCYDGHLVHVAARTLPSWAHWKTAPRGACGHGNGIVVWAGHGDGVLICANGDTETS